MRSQRKLLSEKRLDYLDYVLAGTAGMMATYSVGMALIRPTLGWFFVIAIALGMAISFFVQKKFSGAKWLEVGGFVYFVLALCAIFYAPSLNVLLPEGGFAERELTVAAVLSWMVLLGSWVSWKDSTLLFQAVPSIALFGLVGAFNTFQGSTIAFFIFLLCLATLFARAHGRAMLKQALDSGFAHVETIRQGPWRWMAGPEWALASAAVVVLISVVGAPILRASVKDISGLMRFPLPPVTRGKVDTPPVSIPGSLNSATNSVGIGMGPMILSERLVFRAKLDRPRYLRTGSYSTYQRGSWNKIPLERTAAQIAFDQTMADRRKLIEGENYETVPFAIAFEGIGLSNLPAPGEVTQMDRLDLFLLQLDGGVGVKEFIPPNSVFEGRAAVLKFDAKPVSVPDEVPEFLWRYLSTSDVPPAITDLANRTVFGLASDYEKAMALKAEIERRCKYNLKADKNPPGTDPVEYFLFGPVNEGYCDLFASAMVLMARGVGIPARYVRGYYPLDGLDENGWYPVRESAAHAWAELYFQGIGWVPFDATEGAAAVPGGERGAINDGKSWYERPWFMWSLNSGIGFCVLAAGFVAFRGVRQARSKVDWDQIELARQYEAFTAVLQRASGKPRRPSQTATEYLNGVMDSLGPAKDEALALNKMFIEILYKRPEDHVPAIATLKEPIKRFRKNVKEGLRRV